MFAVLNRSLLPDVDVDAFAQAVDAQLRDDFCPHWPAAVYQPVALVANPGAAGPGDTLITLSDSTAGPGLVIRVDDPRQASVDLSQLVLGLAADPNGDTWMPMPDGRACALDPCDPVDGYAYGKTNGQVVIPVSNFVFVSFFDLVPVGNRHNYLGTYDAWVVAPGGFLRVRNIDGSITDIMGTPGRASRRLSKLAQPSARARGANASDVPTVQCGRLFVSTNVAAEVIAKRGG